MIIIMKLLELIEEIPDPRMENKVVHKLSTILFVALCGVLSGCESWCDICDYCEAKKEWLSRYVDLSSGSPSGWTFRRVLTLLDPNSIERLLREHATWLINKGNKVTKQIAVDGKMLLGSGSKDFRCLQSVSAWCYENGLVLAEEQVEAKSNEITAIPLLLESLSLKGNTVTMDAVACQKSISKLISEKSGQYVFGLKNNQPKLYKAAIDHIEAIGTSKDNLLYDDFDKSHGRLIRRRYFGYDIRSLLEVNGFANAKTVVAVETISSKDNDPARKVSTQWRYYLSSHLHNDKLLPTYIRNHWGIENKLHWILDIHFKEDNDQKAERKSARSFALLRRIALNIVRSKDLNTKVSARRKLKRTCWDNDYLLSLLA